jgi:hypothetical protein
MSRGVFDETGDFPACAGGKGVRFGILLANSYTSLSLPYVNKGKLLLSAPRDLTQSRII